IIDPLMPLLKDKDKDVCDAAVGALKVLGISEEEIESSQNQRELFDSYMGRFSVTSDAKGKIVKYRSPEVRTRLIQLARKLDPPPAIPEEARRALAEGKVNFEKARQPAELASAAESFKIAADLAPWWADAYYNLGLVQEQQASYEAAAENFKNYLLASPNAVDTQTVKDKIYQLEYLHKQNIDAREEAAQGDSYENKPNATDADYGKALEHYRKAVSLDPNYAYAHAYTGTALVALKRYKEALPELREGIRLGYDKDLLTYWGLSICLEKVENNTDEEINVLEAGLQKGAISSARSARGPMLALVYYRLGSAYSRKGQYQRALECHEKARAAGYDYTNDVSIEACKQKIR
ncbi:MAG: tetratricopeptide repeat protein, partial [Candidatus Omnitrophica bacterium]|nr:tetratricopeptide repeat protein [Candidatus Omnitrophota bacterium]